MNTKLATVRAIVLPWETETRSRVDSNGVWAFESVKPYAAWVHPNCAVNVTHGTGTRIAGLSDNSLRTFSADCGMCAEFDLHRTREGMGALSMLRSLGELGASVGLGHLETRMTGQVSTVVDAMVSHITIGARDEMAYSTFAWVEGEPMSPETARARTRYRIGENQHVASMFPQAVVTRSKANDELLFDGVPWAQFMARIAKKDWYQNTQRLLASGVTVPTPSYIAKARAIMGMGRFK